MKILPAMILVFFLCFTTSSFAQRAKIQEGPGGNLTTLLLHPSVKRELKIDKEQITQVEGLARTLREHAKFRPNPRDPLSEQRKKFLLARKEREKLIVELDRKTAALLSKAQRKRATQLLVQFNIAAGYFDAAFDQLGAKPLEGDKRREFEMQLETVPVAVAHIGSVLHHRLTANAVDAISKHHRAAKLLGDHFRFVEYDRDPGDDYERHVIPDESANSE